MRALLVALVPALALAGCTSGEGIAFSGGDARAPDPYYKEHKAILDGEHHEVYALPVLAGARAIQLNATLDTRDHGLPLPSTTAASVRVGLLSPEGVPLGEITLTPQRRSGSLLIEDAPGAGEYLLRVDGVGASSRVEDKSYGAEYRLVAEVVY